jgi:molybdopterin-binding protein
MTSPRPLAEHYNDAVSSWYTETGVVMLSARNQPVGLIKSIKLGDIMAEVVIQVGQFELVSAITRGSADAMGLKVGDQVKAVIKSTEVMVDKP